MDIIEAEDLLDYVMLVRGSHAGEVYRIGNGEYVVRLRGAPHWWLWGLQDWITCCQYMEDFHNRRERDELELAAV